MQNMERDVPPTPRNDADRIPKSPAGAGAVTDAERAAPGGVPQKDEDRAEPAPETL